MIFYAYDGHRPELKGMVLRRLEEREILCKEDYWDSGDHSKNMIRPDGGLEKTNRAGALVRHNNVGDYWRPVDPLISEMLKAKEQTK